MTDRGDKAALPGDEEAETVMHPGTKETPVAMDPPSYPATDDTTDQEPSSTMGWGARFGIAAAVFVVVLVIVLHLSGAVGPGTT